ncbi:MAG: tRNA-dihydrouridine synthase [Dysosmobacter sp.]
MRIGTVEISSQLALAPMAGVTDVAFRQTCAELGARGYTCTELISSKALCYQDKKTRGLLAPFPGEHPFAVQIFGSDPVCMAEAAQIAAGAVRRGRGGHQHGLPHGEDRQQRRRSGPDESDPEKAARIAEAVVKASPVPVTAKFRRGWDMGASERGGAGRAAGAGGRLRRGGPRAHPRPRRRAGRLELHPGREGGLFPSR